MTPEQPQIVAESLAALARSAVERSARNDATSRELLLLRAEMDRSRWSFNSLKRFWPALPALAIACTLLLWWRAPGTLTYQVVGGEKNGSFLSAPADHAVSLAFSDSTLVEVKAGSQMRVEHTSAREPRVALERGAAEVHVVHRAQTRWTFVAGPFEVFVTGTRFKLDWDPAREVMALRLREGSVEIQTPLAATPVTLRAGQEFRADLSKRSMTTAEASAEEEASANAARSHEQDVTRHFEPHALDSATPEPMQPALSESAAPAPATHGPPPTHAAATRSWPKLMAAGKFELLLEQARERGIPECLRSCSASDLSALSDAARYAGHFDVADQGLRALRSRFGRQQEGKGAAFLLGRLRERQGAAGDALGWYQTYLAEAAGGSYAAEALAGQMRTTRALKGAAAAKPLAEEYLRRYPNGVHAGTARSLVGSP
jgi:hypothetical protein